MHNTKLVYNKKIRSVLNGKNQKWFYCLNDVIKVLTNVKDAKNYLKQRRQRDEELANNWSKLVIPLVMDTAGGKQKVMCTDAEGLLHIIQNMRSQQKELFKHWLGRIKQ